MIYTGGRCGKTALGFDGNKLCLYVSDDGSGDARTPEALCAELDALGWDSAIMLDSGGSTQCGMNGKRIVSSRDVHNLILVGLLKNLPRRRKTVKPKARPQDRKTAREHTYMP